MNTRLSRELTGSGCKLSRIAIQASQIPGRKLDNPFIMTSVVSNFLTRVHSE